MCYAARIGCGLMKAWDLERLTSHSVLKVGQDRGPRSKGPILLGVTSSLQQLPTVPLLTSGVNLAPALVIRRIYG